MGRIAAAPAARRQRTQELLDWLLRNGRREKLCGEVAGITGAPYALVEDALQDVCLRAVTTHKCRGQTEGEVYNWLLTATLRRVAQLRSRAYQRHEVLVDSCDDDRASDGADVEVLEREREQELGELALTVVAQLDQRQRQVAALHSRRMRGREIARYLGTSERRVKHLKYETFARARDVLIDAAGGGCEAGERLISRFAFGLAGPRERAEAQLHLSGCGRCSALYQRLELFHDKVAALLPIPAAAEIDPALIERGLHATSDTLAHAKQQLADAASQAKQHAAAGYTRAVEYTPLASMRPGAAASAIAGCLALGGGAASYCIDRGVDPITGLVDVIQPAPAEPEPQEPQRSPATEQPSDPAQTAPMPQQPPPAAPTEPPVQPETQPAPPREPPAEPTPAGVQFGVPATPTQAAQSTAPRPEQPARPVPAPQSGGTDLYGP